MKPTEKGKVSESRLRRIIRESIDNALGQEKEEESGLNEIEQALEILDNLINGGFIPFSSPHPSSTEKAIKIRVTKAAELLEEATRLCKSLGY